MPRNKVATSIKWVC